MNYEVKSKKGNQPLKTSIWWATVGENAWSEIGITSTLIVVSTVMLIDTANIDDFTFNVCRVNNRGLDDLDRHNIKKTYNKYIKILKAVNVFIIIYFIGYTAFMIKQFTFYMGW